MATIELRGHITKGGKLEVELPDDLPEGEVKVTIEVPTAEKEPSPRRSLYGLWADLNVDLSAEEIDQARSEMWRSWLGSGKGE